MGIIWSLMIGILLCIESKWLNMEKKQPCKKEKRAARWYFYDPEPANSKCYSLNFVQTSGNHHTKASSCVVLANMGVTASLHVVPANAKGQNAKNQLYKASHAQDSPHTKLHIHEHLRPEKACIRALKWECFNSHWTFAIFALLSCLVGKGRQPTAIVPLAEVIIFSACEAPSLSLQA